MLIKRNRIRSIILLKNENPNGFMITIKLYKVLEKNYRRK